MFKNLFSKGKHVRKINFLKVFPIVLGSSEKLNDLFSAGKPLYAELTDDLRIYFGEQTWNGLQYLTTANTDREVEEIKDLSLQNLAAEVQKKGIDIQGDGLIHEVHFDQKKETSLLLIDNLWSNILKQVNDDIVVAAPSRDTLLFCARSDEQNVNELKTIAANMHESNSFKGTDKLLTRSFMGVWNALEG